MQSTVATFVVLALCVCIAAALPAGANNDRPSDKEFLTCCQARKEIDIATRLVFCNYTNLGEVLNKVSPKASSGAEGGDAIEPLLKGKGSIAYFRCLTAGRDVTDCCMGRGIGRYFRTLRRLLLLYLASVSGLAQATSC